LATDVGCTLLVSGSATRGASQSFNIGWDIASPMRKTAGLGDLVTVLIRLEVLVDLRDLRP
jgi:hypothetical protein